MNPVKLLVGAFFSLAAPALLVAAGYWLAADMPALSVGPCPLCLHFGQGVGVKYAQLEAAEAAAGQRAKAVDTRTAAISQAAGVADEAAQTRIVTVYRTLAKEVPVVLTHEIDRAFPLPVGFVRLHDAAARGVALSDLPDPAGRPDDAASGIAASDAATVIVGNYGRCREDDEQLAALQQWARQVAAAEAAPPPAPP